MFLDRKLAFEYLSRPKSSMNYVRPRVLTRGDRIAIVSPSSSVDSKEVYAGIQILKKKGLVPVLGPNLTQIQSDGLYSAPLKERVKEMLWAFADDSIDAILVADGGFGSAQLLPYLDYEGIRQSRKLFMGYSDATALNMALLARSGLCNFNGPMAAVRIEEEEKKGKDIRALSDALDLLMDGEIWGSRPFCRMSRIPRCVYPGKVRGRAFGGNLDTFVRLLGTPYFPDCRGGILFLEDIRCGGYLLAQSLTQLKLAGVLEDIEGIVFGEFKKTPRVEDRGDPSVEEVVVEFFKRGPPCVYGFNFSHGDDIAVIPMGIPTLLDATNARVFFGRVF